MSSSTSKSVVVYGNNRTKPEGASGWAAFDRKQRQKQQTLEADVGTEPYPSLSGPKNAQILLDKNATPLEKPFASVVASPMNFPSLMDKGLQMGVPVANLSLGAASETETAIPPEVYRKLDRLRTLVDESLIQDVLAGLNNDIQEALSLLEAMLISDDRDTMNKNADPSYGNGNDTSFSNIIDDSFEDGYVESDHETSSKMLLDAATKSLLIEPEFEWEEDDVYLLHRKDAIKMLRSASRHSKASSDAYLRGDHLSAQIFSLKAQEEWIAADKLNSMAAKYILTLRNHNNDMWKLDLHGLHAAEAVQALQERLQKIESQVSSNCLVAPKGDHKEPNTLVSASVQSRSHAQIQKSGGRQPSSMRRPRLLQAITGKGIHSRGAAALPSAIRNFLSENGYHFDETRPGVIMIRPKFRLL